MEEQAGVLSLEEKSRKVAHFERFIEERLKVDLHNIAKAEEKLRTQLEAL